MLDTGQQQLLAAGCHRLMRALPAARCSIVASRQQRSQRAAVSGAAAAGLAAHSAANSHEAMPRPPTQEPL
eukprot:COSAG01_NODE_54693_length_330_cov_0.900433_1_plen_70_part_01